MKIGYCLAVAAAFAITATVDLNAAETADKPKLSREEMRARGEARKAQIEARHGGKVRNTVNQRGKIVVVNAQKEVDAAQISEPMAKLSAFLKVAIEVQCAESADPMQARALKAEKGADALLMVVSCDKCSEPMMIAPDGAWAVVNVKALGDKNVDSRLRKEVVRAFAYLCGGTKSQYADPMTAAVTDIRQLDLVEQAELPVDVLMRIPEYLKTLGVTQYQEASYQTACKQGWAPAPTNEVQKAIWEKTKAEKNETPANPIKIEPGQKPLGK